MKNLIFIAVLLMLLTGCATVPAERYQPPETLTRSWRYYDGYPTYPYPPAYWWRHRLPCERRWYRKYPCYPPYPPPPPEFGYEEGWRRGEREKEWRDFYESYRRGYKRGLDP